MTLQKLIGERATWINIPRPTPRDVEALRRLYPYIHPLHLEDILSPSERPKIDDDEHYLLVVMQFPLWDPVNRLTRPAEVDLFVGRGYVVTVHDDTLRPLTQLYEDCSANEEARRRLLDHGGSHAFYVIVDRLVDYIFPILRRVDGNIRAIEEGIFSAKGNQIIRDISLARRDIIALRRIIRQQVPIMENLERVDRPIIREELDEYFGDILDHLYRARDIIDEDSEIISGLADTADTLISHRLNGVIQTLTVFSVIMLPLTFITSLYGMNISLPLEGHPMAFPIVALIMLGVTVGMLAFFRYRRWM
ncbi:MAG: magnesium transporter CorA family protein [Chloroflexi bacterium]|nr:magnesium transporter CorA family protein [Chloroflexota bacterium]